MLSGAESANPLGTEKGDRWVRADVELGRSLPPFRARPAQGYPEGWSNGRDAGHFEHQFVLGRSRPVASRIDLV